MNTQKQIHRGLGIDPATASIAAQSAAGVVVGIADIFMGTQTEREAIALAHTQRMTEMANLANEQRRLINLAIDQERQDRDAEAKRIEKEEREAEKQELLIALSQIEGLYNEQLLFLNAAKTYSTRLNTIFGSDIFSTAVDFKAIAEAYSQKIANAILQANKGYEGLEAQQTELNTLLTEIETLNQTLKTQTAQAEELGQLRITIIAFREEKINKSWSKWEAPTDTTAAEILAKNGYITQSGSDEADAALAEILISGEYGPKYHSMNNDYDNQTISWLNKRYVGWEKYKEFGKNVKAYAQVKALTEQLKKSLDEKTTRRNTLVKTLSEKKKPQAFNQIRRDILNGTINRANFLEAFRYFYSGLHLLEAIPKYLETNTEKISLLFSCYFIYGLNVPKWNDDLYVRLLAAPEIISELIQGRRGLSKAFSKYMDYSLDTPAPFVRPNEAEALLKWMILTPDEGEVSKYFRSFEKAVEQSKELRLVKNTEKILNKAFEKRTEHLGGLLLKFLKDRVTFSAQGSLSAISTSAAAINKAFLDYFNQDLAAGNYRMVKTDAGLGAGFAASFEALMPLNELFSIQENTTDQRFKTYMEGFAAFLNEQQGLFLNSTAQIGRAVTLLFNNNISPDRLNITAEDMCIAFPQLRLLNEGVYRTTDEGYFLLLNEFERKILDNKKAQLDRPRRGNNSKNTAAKTAAPSCLPSA